MTAGPGKDSCTISTSTTIAIAAAVVRTIAIAITKMFIPQQEGGSPSESVLLCLFAQKSFSPSLRDKQMMLASKTDDHEQRKNNVR